MSEKEKIEVPIDCTVHAAGGFLPLRQDIGKATGEGGEQYAMSTAFGSGNPIIELPDGRWITFSWNALCCASRLAGIEAK